ncbi:MAG TPA: hypothetical protein VG890_04280 [Puia sp.]|nr:hypothetical protein [Puia sp.]
MANSNNSAITGKFSGTLNKELVFRDWEGKTVVAKAPKARKGDPSPGQVELRERFLLASIYAKSIADKDGGDQAMKDAYSRVLRPRQNLYSRALEDFLTPPVVKSIDASAYTGAVGGLIKVRAFDDFRVTAVQVEIYSAAGALVEKGNAVQEINGLDWDYTATLANNPPAGSKVKAIATDVPGNAGTLELTL